MANETSITDIALNSSCCDNGTIGEGIYGINKDETNTKTFNVTDMSDPMQPVRIVIATIYIAVFIFGVAGNGIILYTLMKVVKNRSVTDLYILGLAISDFLFVAMLPITATDMLMGNQWIFGGVVCKLFVSVNYLALCAGVLIVTAMSVDRFQNVVFAIKMMGVRTTKRANIIIIVVWSFSVLYMVPATITARVSEVINGSNVMACSLKYEDLSETLTAEKIATIHTVFRFFVVFLVPSIIMVFCNATIVHFLRKRREKKQKKKATTSDKDHKAQAHKREQDRITRLILIVTSVFLVCFFPNLILNTVWVLSLMTPGLINQSNSQIFSCISMVECMLIVHQFCTESFTICVFR
uniref:delta-type opioid receptor-like n=1 Tax=Styela clava TaxID=7725 RepID=UPI001939D9FC|nr:delta-type opioid receptor-like [Styela clava]